MWLQNDANCCYNELTKLIQIYILYSVSYEFLNIYLSPLDKDGLL